MKHARWLDHLPPWFALGGLASAGIFEWHELGIMALPLVMAATVELRSIQLSRFERWLNVGAALFAVTLWFFRIQIMPAIAFLLCLLCAIRLSLPRTLGQRRQLLLMGFLLYLISALATFNLISGIWLLVWIALVCATFMQHAWEQGQRHTVGAGARPPFRKLMAYVGGTLMLAAPLFFLMPRLTQGSQPSWLPGFGWGSNTAGFSDRVDLEHAGPVSANDQVVLRVIPRGRLGDHPEEAARRLALLRGTALERYSDGIWQPSELTPPPIGQAGLGLSDMKVDYFLYPSPTPLIPVPYGLQSVATPFQPMDMPGGGLLVPMAPRQVLSFTVIFRQDIAPIERQVDSAMSLHRERLLLDPGDSTEYLLHWSRSILPPASSPQDTVRHLSQRLQSFQYSKENPSGRAPNPLRDFVERTQAGHCEYFAAALALALRHHGIPARIVNGYRLGEWNAAGKYFTVTQNEAHSWVEWYDRAHKLWLAEDPTPSGEGHGGHRQGLLASLRVWLDAMSFRWDRYVVRLSDADQHAGLVHIQTWLAHLQGATRSLSSWQPIGWAAALMLLLRVIWRHRRATWSVPWGRSGDLPHLRPLLARCARHAPPAPGETARQWLHRLAQLRRERADALKRIAELADQVGYGQGDPQTLVELIAQERRAWRGWKG